LIKKPHPEWMGKNDLSIGNDALWFSMRTQQMYSLIVNRTWRNYGIYIQAYE
jgi:hypothetical protein